MSLGGLGQLTALTPSMSQIAHCLCGRRGRCSGYTQLHTSHGHNMAEECYSETFTNNQKQKSLAVVSSHYPGRDLQLGSTMREPWPPAAVPSDVKSLKGITPHHRLQRHAYPKHILQALQAIQYWDQEPTNMIWVSSIYIAINRLKE